MRTVTAFLLIILLAGCARPAAKAPVKEPVSEAITAPTAPKPPVAPSTSQEKPAERSSIPGGFRLGPIQGATALRWLGADRVALGYYSGGGLIQGAIALAGGGLEKLPPEKPLPYNGGTQQTNPSRSRVVIYGKGGAGLLVNRETGAEKQLEKGYWAQAGFDQWSPTGERYLVQSVREDPVPGFYFFDPDGNLVGSFAEPGHFAMWASWSPDGKQVAFLSVPMNVRYPRSPEEWAEVPFAPRVGILDVAAGKARYVDLAGKHFFGTPAWSPDGSKLAVVCGDLATKKNNPPFDKFEITTLRQSHPCAIDTKSLAVTALGAPAEADTLFYIENWSPDGSAVLAHFYVDDPNGRQRTRLFPLQGEPAWSPTGELFWLDGGRMLVLEPGGRLQLINRQKGPDGVVTSARQYLESTGPVTQVVVSPDRRRFAFLTSLGGERYELVVMEPGQ